MTKFKELAQVVTDNAFRSFPIDKERYELFVALDMWLDFKGRDDLWCLDTMPVYGSWNANEWHLATRSLAIEGASALSRCLLSDWQPSRIVQDRARRFSASLDLDQSEIADLNLEPEVRFAELHNLFWRGVRDRMTTTRGFISTSFSKDKGVTT